MHFVQFSYVMHYSPIAQPQQQRQRPHDFRRRPKPSSAEERREKRQARHGAQQQGGLAGCEVEVGGHLANHVTHVVQHEEDYGVPRAQGGILGE